VLETQRKILENGELSDEYDLVITQADDIHDRYFGYTLAGARIADADGIGEVDVATGSSFASDGGQWHEVINIGASTGVFLIIEPK